MRDLVISMSVPHEMKNALAVESLFNTLKAENEPWLGAVFVSLPVFERLRGDHSTILYGETGSGKTALRLELKRQQGSRTFSALWMPEPIIENPATGTELAHQAMRQALRACLENVILEGQLPQRLNEPSNHVASALQWFLRNYLPFDPVFYIHSQTDQMGSEDARWYLTLLERSVPSIITEQTSLKDQIGLLLAVLRQAKYEQLWLAIDGLERWTPRQAGEQVTALMDAILSTLILFDVRGIAYKFFLPASLMGNLHGTIGVERHRAQELQLRWSVEDLHAVLTKRVEYGFSPKRASMSSVCEEGEFLNWLKEFGGNSPRAWLQFTALLIAEYQERGRRLNGVQTREFIREHPAPLRLHLERREVWLGKKCIPIGSVAEFRVLEYLFARPGKIGSLEELYYYAQAELNAVPDGADPKWVPPKTWRGAMDTLIWRLRQKIEPDPGEPLYLITHHGKGLELLHTAV